MMQDRMADAWQRHGRTAQDDFLCPGGQRHNVLLVDDEPHILASVRRVLHKEPYDILCASSAEQAFVYLHARTVKEVRT